MDLKTVRAKNVNIHKLEVFDSDGILLGHFPLKHYAHGVPIFGDSLFIWESSQSNVYQYKIVDLK